MHESQRTEAVRALDAVLVQIYPALIAVRRARPHLLEVETEQFKHGLRLAADALEELFDSTPMRVLRFVLRDNADRDLPGAVVELRDALTRVAGAHGFDPAEAVTAWKRFVARLADSEILVDEIAVGSPFDPARHDAVAGSSGSSNDTVREVLTPGLAVHGTRVAWARVRTGSKILA